MANYADATKRFRDEITATMHYTDLSLSREGLTRVQQQRVDAAREQLLAARPNIRSAAPSRDSVLTGMRPSSADEVAVLQHEQSKISALLDAGRSVSQIVSSADRGRLVALADLAETLPQVVASKHGDEIAAEVRSIAFDRLVELGDPVAVEAKRVEDAAAVPLAWHRAMTEAAERFDLSVDAMQDVYRVDPVGYDLALSDTAGVGVPAAKWLAVLDASANRAPVNA